MPYAWFNRKWLAYQHPLILPCIVLQRQNIQHIVLVLAFEMDARKRFEWKTHSDFITPEFEFEAVNAQFAGGKNGRKSFDHRAFQAKKRNIYLFWTLNGCLKFI